MRLSSRFPRVGLCAFGVILALAPTVALSQRADPATVGTDSVTIAAGAHYRAGGFRRFLVGGAYRDLWTTPIRVPVLDLRCFAGGLRPKKEGGGMETKSLRLITSGGIEYVFRSVDKDQVALAKVWKGTIVERVSFDQFARTYPGAPVMAAPILKAAGVLQTTPVFAVMPDDTLLGKFRADYAGRLGMIELSPTNPKDAPEFTGAVGIIDSDTLLRLLNRDPTQRIDAPALLAARLMDMLLNDWDRHPGQWKWAGFQSGLETVWEPIPRDRDFAFNAFSGLLAGVARLMSPNVAGFTGTYPPLQGLTRGSLEFDRRLLTGLGKPEWDSVAQALMRKVTDSAINTAMQVMPPEYQALTPNIVSTLRQRRDGLADLASRFYSLLATVVDIHATDAADRATVTRVDDQFVEVGLESGDGRPYFRRRFDSRETQEIRLYLHGGDDSAIVIGHVTRSIPVRIIGGNGINQLIDSSTVGGRRDPTELLDVVKTADAGYRPDPRPSQRALVSGLDRRGPAAAHLHDVGMVTGVSYGLDTLFNRRPLMSEFGKLVPQGPDYGSRSKPIIGVGANRDLGLVPHLGMTRYRYGFGHYPYSSMVGLEGEYSLRVDGFKVGLTADKRRENSPLHFTALARMSQLELINFHGFGNSTPQSPTDFFAVRQRQWLLQPAVALALSPSTDLSFGPVFQYSGTDNTPNHFVSSTKPYGFGRSGAFGEAGLRLGLHRDSRVPASPRHAHTGMQLDLGGSFFPAVWDVSNAFATISAATTVYVTLPVPTHPNLVLRGGGKKVFGDAPFQEAAFIGGTTTVRALDLQRYGGDASLYTGAELRVPVAQFSLIVPLKLGLLASEDIGRVYVRGASPGGWHNTFGAGFWVAFDDLSLDVRVVNVTELGRPQMIMVRLALP